VSTQTGRIISQDDNSSLIEFSTGCQTCNGCANRKPQRIRMSGQYSENVSLRLGLRDQVYALFNSLLLPLLLGMVLAFVADWLLLNEWWGIFAACCGFTIGMVLCRPLGVTALEIKETS
jgi:hypothetical protein